MSEDHTMRHVAFVRLYRNCYLIFKYMHLIYHYFYEMHL